MTLTEFVQRNDGHYLDYDGRYGAQCVDLIDYYCQEVLGIPIVWADAIRWYGQDNAYLTWVLNNPADQAQMPPPGAIVVWRQNYKVGTGVNGHIDICISSTGISFIGFDQNWPPNSPCHVVHHTYEGVIGWGIHKGGTMSAQSEQEIHEIWLALGGDQIKNGVNYLGWTQEVKALLVQVAVKIASVFK